MKTLAQLICAVVVATSHAQIRLDTAVPIPSNDSIYPALEQYWNDVLKRYRGSNEWMPPNNPRFFKIDTAATSNVFPQLRFAAVNWLERGRPGVLRKGASPDPWGVTETVAVEKTSNHIQLVLMEYGNYEEYGS